MKKIFAVSLIALAITGCKTEIEKDISLKEILSEPIKTETALLNVELITCNSLEDSRLPSDDLQEIQQKIPQVFSQAKYKECYSKRAHSFAVFEIPVGVGKAETDQKFENDITIYSFDSRVINVKTSDTFAKNISKFVKKEIFMEINLDVSLNVKNDTGEDQYFSAYSTYIDNAPVDILSKLTFKKDETLHFKLSNSSVDKLWKYEKGAYSIVLSQPVDFSKIFNQ